MPDEPLPVLWRERGHGAMSVTQLTCELRQRRIVPLWPGPRGRAHLESPNGRRLLHTRGILPRARADRLARGTFGRARGAGYLPISDATGGVSRIFAG
ncbi:hypothetical protein GCM10010177_00900 [Actinomadura citrea]|nr:hypothetical protein GCM10010177_00900 [Actinomadura citrea]